jgi:hypothetical protein
MGLTISEVRQSLGGEQDAKHYFHKYKEKRHRDRIQNRANNSGPVFGLANEAA